jgi:hypothetical protein
MAPNLALAAEEEKGAEARIRRKKKRKKKKREHGKNKIARPNNTDNAGRYGSRWYLSHDNKRFGSQNCQTSLCK